MAETGQGALAQKLLGQPGRFSGLSKFLDIQQAFMDAQRQHQYKLQEGQQQIDAYDRRSETTAQSGLLESGIQSGQLRFGAGDFASGQMPPIEVNPNYTGKINPSMENAKNKRVENFLTTVETSNSQREAIAEAMQAAEKIDSGIYGKVSRNWAKNLNPNDPGLEDWQKIKMVLLDSQLMYVAKTKGAIAKHEMDLFGDAAANDDVSSIKRMMPVFKRAMKAVNDTERGLAKSYQRSYKEDPYTWAETFSNIAEYENLDFGGNVQTFNIGGKTYHIPKDQVAEFKKDMGL